MRREGDVEIEVRTGRQEERRAPRGEYRTAKLKRDRSLSRENYAQESNSNTPDTSKSNNREVERIEDRNTRGCIRKSLDALKPTVFANFVTAFDSLVCFGR